MGYDRNLVLNVARGELDYHEKATNDQLDDKLANAGSGNYTKYARDLDALGFFYNGPKQGFAYCDVGVDWSFVKAYGVEAALKLLCQPRYSAGAGCYYSAMYYRQYGQFHDSNTVPQPGDQIFFTYQEGEVSHTGIVESVTGTKITVIEFNTSDMVARRTYTVGQACIFGYGRPEWGADVEEDPTTPAITPTPPPSMPEKQEMYTIELPVLKEGMKGSNVEAAQTLLILRGCSCGRKFYNGSERADGDFGPITTAAVKQFQTDNALTVDGEIGPQTMTALLK